MPKFEFRLASVKKYRENRILLAKKDFLKLESEIANLKLDLESIAHERSEDIEGSQKKIANFAFARVHASFIEDHDRKMEITRGEIQRLEEELDRQRRWLVHVGQELRIVEKLEQRQKERFDSEQRLIEKRRGEQWVAEHWKAEES